MGNNKTRFIAITALLLALCIVSQFFKNLSVFITGPIINCILVIATLSVGLLSGIILSVITPITSFLITGSPIMSALPLVIPCVMIGNCLLCAGVSFFYRGKKSDVKMLIGMGVGVVAKAAFMGTVISGVILGTMGPNSGLPEKAIGMAKQTFSVTQFITAAIGCGAAFVMWKVVRIALNTEGLTQD